MNNLNENLARAITLLTDGAVVAVPTETVYGLAANAYSDAAVAAIYACKNRPAFNPLIIHCQSLDQIKTFAMVDARAAQLAEAFWPGPLTMVLPLIPGAAVSRLATAGLSTVAVRIPAHPLFQELLRELPFPLAAPSANRSESISPTTAAHVRRSFEGGGGPALILDGGACAIGLESTIVDLTTPACIVLRPGGLDLEDIERVLGQKVSEAAADSAIKAPGQMRRHYAPQKPLRLNVTSVGAEEGLLAFGPPLEGPALTCNLSATSDLREAATNLFAMLHVLDQSTVTAIAVQPIPNTGLGRAINDRLTRAVS